MFVVINSGTVVGIDAVKVSVEVDITPSSFSFSLVGLPDIAVKESSQRVWSAISNSNLNLPRTKCVVNLAPANLRKEGSSFDLPIALGMLVASSQMMSARLSKTMVLGELSLDGSIRAIKGALPLAVAAEELGFERIILPYDNGAEAAVVDGIEVVGARSLSEVVAWANGKGVMEVMRCEEATDIDYGEGQFVDDFADVKGQSQAKRAFEIAAAGGHNLIMIGPPGSGKTMLSKRFPTILPPLTRSEAMETTKIYSVAGKLGVRDGVLRCRPFRSPHHLSSQVSIVGGGSSPQPGEVSLANNGVLFLDELPEFNRSVLEVLRQPLEELSVSISRAKYSVEYPAKFTLIASMNPCPCGYYNHPTVRCSCSEGAVQRYLGRISGPLLDRIDLQVEIAPVSINQINGEDEVQEESSAEIRKRVVAARERQAQRFAGVRQVTGEGVTKEVTTNAMMSSKMLREFCPLNVQSRKILEMAMERLQLSARAYDRIIKVARTIADLEGRDDIDTSDISEAIGYRSLDRESWGAKS